MPRPNEELILDLRVSARVSTSDETDTKQDEPNFKLRVDMTEAPVLEAAVKEGYILKGTLTSEFNSVGLLAAVTDASGIPRPHCTGTVIGESTVLTAAHCLNSDKIKSLISNRQLLFMIGNNLDNMTPIPVSSFDIPTGDPPEKFKFNEKFDHTLEDDIAILRT